MRVFFALVRRELGGAFNSLIGFVVMAVAALLTGISVVDLVTKLIDRPTDAPVTELFYQSAYFWVILLVVSPIITMRTFAAEKSSGTYEALMTTPVGDWQVVLAKFVGALVFFALTWLPLLAVLFVLRRISGEPGLFLPGATASAFLGVLLVGSLYMALGCFASALTQSQIIAAMVAFLLGIGLWVLSLRPPAANPAEGKLARALDHLSMLRHMEDFARGVLDSRHITFYVTLTVLFLFLTQRVVESRRWK
ncbi:MAG TPA: ABC transporter permease [Verrucomicrobiota bacterium]|nr:ABC transporter permease [Verrucomicrobiales bacterium]HRI14497.1 ABC transporter permease [Verrucomicrobiota bacterium]